MRAYVDQALAEVSALPVSPERETVRALLLTVRAGDWFFKSDLPAARRDALAARELATSLGDREAILESDLLLARIDIVEGRYQTGLRDGLRAARAARDAGFEGVGVTGYRNLAILAARIMDAPTAEMAIGEGLQYADAIEQSHCRQMMSTTKAVLEWAGGHWDAADASGTPGARRAGMPARRHRFARRHRARCARPRPPGRGTPLARGVARRPVGTSGRSSSS